MRSPRRFDVILDNVLNHPPKAAARLDQATSAVTRMLGHHASGKIAITV